MTLGVPFQKLSTELSTESLGQCITFILLVDKSTISVDKYISYAHASRARSIALCDAQMCADIFV